MKKFSSYSKRENRIIELGYFWHWGSIVITFLIPAITFWICNLLNTDPKAQGLLTSLSAGIIMVCIGAYEIIGTVLEFKHLLVSLQLATHIPFQNINPKRAWTKAEKRDYICIGTIFLIIGLSIITISLVAIR